MRCRVPRNDSEPAHPSPQYQHCPGCREPIPWSPGLSKRERYALELMKTLLANLPADAKVVARDIASDAVNLADALAETLDTM